MKGDALLAGLGASALSAATFLALRPLFLAFPASGLDASWVAVLGEAATRSARWGVDLAFTYGPASALVTHFYTDGYLAAALPALGLVALVQGNCTALLAREALREAARGAVRGAPRVRGGHPGGAALLLAAVAAQAVGVGAEVVQDPDAFYIALALSLALLDLVRRPGERAPLAVLAAGAAAFGVLALAKTSYGAAALGLFVLADLRAALARRRAPLAVPAFALGFLAAFAACGQRFGDLPAYLSLQGQVAAGYGAAMYLPVRGAEVAGFLAAAAALAAALAAGTARRGWLDAAFAVLELALALAVAFKAGFVRADGHVQIAWAALGLAALSVGTGVALARSAAGAAALWAAGLASLWVAAPLFQLADSGRPATASELSGVYAAAGRTARGEVEAWARLLSDPAGFAAAARASKAAAWAAIVAAHPLPALAGTVDAIPSIQSDVLAARLDYRPRPSFQEYATYTAGLIAANVAFFEGPGAPEWVLWGAAALDDRLPAMAEGASWPALLRRYEPVRRLGAEPNAPLLLHRRPSPLPEVLGEPVRLRARLGEPLDLRAAMGRIAGPVFARVAVRETALGRLASLLFRPPALTLRLISASGEASDSRFVPGIAAGGFLLSPAVDDAESFAALAFGQDGGDRAGTPMEAPAGMLVGGSRAAALAYDGDVEVELRPVAVAAPPPSAEAADLAAAVARSAAWRRLARAAGRGGALDGDRLSAPAPDAVTLPTGGARRLRVAFGIEDEAWSGGNRTGGACFAIKRAGGADGSGDPALWRRCLDPLAVPADRGPQSAEVDLPPGTGAVTAETACRGSCDWGWSYWDGIAPAP